MKLLNIINLGVQQVPPEAKHVDEVSLADRLEYGTWS